MKSSRGTAFGLVVAALGLLFWAAIGSTVIRLAFQRDFLNLYTGGVLARTGHFSDLYDFRLQTAIQDSLVPGLPVHFPFVRPPFYALMLAPLSLLPIQIAFPVWIGLQTCGMFGVWVWAWRRFGPESMVYCAFFLPASLGIAHGQDCIILLLEMLAVWLLMERKLDFVAGLILGLALFKFHLFLLLPLAILLRRRWRLLGGYAVGGTSLAVFSVLLVGEAGVRGYWELLMRKDLISLSPSPEMMVCMNAIAVNLGIDQIWFRVMLLAIPIGIALWSTWRTEDERRWFWSAVIGSMLLSPHTFEYDVSSLLIPGLLVAFAGPDKLTRIMGAVVLMPLAYFLTLAGTPWAMAPSLLVLTFLFAMSGLWPYLSTLRSRLASVNESTVSHQR